MKHLGTGVAHLGLALALLLGAVYLAVRDGGTVTPRLFEARHMALSGCSAKELGSLVLRISCADPLGIRAIGSSVDIRRVAD